MEVPQHGHFLGPGVLQIVPVDQVDTAVYHRFLDGLQPRLAPHDQLHEGQDEIAFQRQGVVVLGVVEVQVHGVDVLIGRGGNVNHLTAQPPHQGRILVLRVDDGDIVLGNEKGVGDLPLGREGLAAAGSAQNQAVGGFELLSVCHDEVVGQSVEAVVQRLAAHEQLLGGEGDENGGAGGGEAPLNVDLVQTQGEGGHEALLLLPIQPPQGTVILLGNSRRLEHIGFQTLPPVRQIQHQHRHQEHPLIPALQVLQQRLGLSPVGIQITGNDVHVISGADGLLLLLDLHAVQVGELPLDIFDGGVLVDGLDVQRHHLAVLQVQEVLQHFVRQLRGQNLQEGRRAVGPADLEHPAILEGEAVRGDEVLAGQPGFPDGVPGEAELLPARGVEHLVQDRQPLIAAERVRPDAQHLEISQDIRLHPLQPGLGRFQALRLHAEGDVLGLGQAVVALGELISEHIRVFLPDAVVGVDLLRDANGPLVFLHVGALIEEGELDVDGAVKIVEKVTVILKNPVFILVLGQLIVDIVKTNLLGVVAVRHHTDPVPAHLPVGDGLLGGLGEPAVQLGLFHGGHQPPLVRAGQLGLRGKPDGVPQVGLICFVPLFCCVQIFCLCFLLLCLQPLSPPFHFGSAAPGRRTGFRCGRGGSGVPGTAPGRSGPAPSPGAGRPSRRCRTGRRAA